MTAMYVSDDPARSLSLEEIEKRNLERRKKLLEERAKRNQEITQQLKVSKKAKETKSKPPSKPTPA